MHRLMKSEGIMGHYEYILFKSIQKPKKINGKETDEDISIN